MSAVFVQLCWPAQQEARPPWFEASSSERHCAYVLTLTTQSTNQSEHSDVHSVSRRPRPVGSSGRGGSFSCWPSVATSPSSDCSADAPPAATSACASLRRPDDAALATLAGQEVRAPHAFPEDAQGESALAEYASRPPPLPLLPRDALLSAMRLSRIVRNVLLPSTATPPPPLLAQSCCVLPVQFVSQSPMSTWVIVRKTHALQLCARTQPPRVVLAAGYARLPPVMRRLCSSTVAPTLPPSCTSTTRTLCWALSVTCPTPTSASVRFMTRPDSSARIADAPETSYSPAAILMHV